MIIGISGTLGSGKDTVAKIVGSKGFQHFSTADILRTETSKLGREIDRETLRTTGNELRRKYGSGFLAELALKMAGQSQNMVVSGLRSPGEIDFLKNQKNFYLFFVDAPVELRYQRITGRGRNLEDKSDLESFKKSEELETRGDENSQVLSYCKQQADYVIKNVGTFEDLEGKVFDILTKLGQIE
jgi:dephospho-CoA kinase